MNLIRIFLSSSDATSNPISYEVYRVKFQWDYQLLGSRLLNFPDSRNIADLKHYTEILLNDYIYYENIKIIFPDVEGNFDTTYRAGKACKDYLLIIGKIKLYRWC